MKILILFHSVSASGLPKAAIWVWAQAPPIYEFEWWKGANKHNLIFAFFNTFPYPIYECAQSYSYWTNQNKTESIGSVGR